MRLFICWLVLAAAIFFAFILQELFPPLSFLGGARLILVPMLFCYGALAFPLWAAALLAFFTGFLTDLMYLNVVDQRVEIAIGWSIVYFVLFGLFAHGFQPAFERGHWWLHPLLSAVATSAFLALQYAMISFRREGLVLHEVVAWRILGPGLMAGLLAPFLHLAAPLAGSFTPPEERDPARRPFSGR